MDEIIGVHYRTGGKLLHAGCEMLPKGEDIEYIVIKEIEYDRENDIWTATFEKNPYTKLPMRLNSTNRKRLSKLFPECRGLINLLKNIPVRLTQEKCRDPQDGGDTYGLRISKIPARLPHKNIDRLMLTPNDKKIWEQAVQFLISGASIDKIKNKYVLTEEDENRLLNEAQKQIQDGTNKH